MIEFVYMIHRIPGMSQEQFVDHPRNQHGPLFVSIPAAALYVRGHTVSHPVAAPAYTSAARDTSASASGSRSSRCGRALEAQLTEEFWSSLELYVRERLGELREGFALVAATTLAERTPAEGLLSAHVDELTRWGAKAPALEESWRELPSIVDVPLPPPGGPSACGLAGPEHASFATGSLRAPPPPRRALLPAGDAHRGRPR